MKRISWFGLLQLSSLLLLLLLGVAEAEPSGWPAQTLRRLEHALHAPDPCVPPVPPVPPGTGEPRQAPA